MSILASVSSGCELYLSWQKRVVCCGIQSTHGQGEAGVSLFRTFIWFVLW